MYDFEVDLESLVTAAQSTAESVQMMKDHDVEDFVPTQAMVGHAEVWAACSEFKDRWERGVQDLVSDVEEISGRLGQVAKTYIDFDNAGQKTLSASASAAQALQSFATN